MRKTGISLLINIAFILFGAVFLFAGHKITSNHEKLINDCDVSTTGTVIDNQLEYTDDSQSYYPIFQFEYDGNVYSARYSVGSYPASFNVGDTAELLISSKDTTKFFFVKGDKSYKLFERVFTGAGWLFIGFGIIYPLIVKFFARKNGLSDNNGDDEISEDP